MNRIKKQYKLCKRERKYFCITIPCKFVRDCLLSKSNEIFYYVDKDNRLILISYKLEIEDATNSKLRYLGSYRISRKGNRGWVASVPYDWVKIVNGKLGDYLNYYLEYIDINDSRLIIIKGDA